MADTQQGGAGGASAGQAGQGSNPRSSGSGSGMADQAKEALRNVTDRASDTWDDVSKRGGDYYRQGSQAVSNVDSSTMTAMFIAGTIGFGIAWLIFGQRSYSGDYIPRRMSASSDRRY